MISHILGQLPAVEPVSGLPTSTVSAWAPAQVVKAATVDTAKIAARRRTRFSDQIGFCLHVGCLFTVAAWYPPLKDGAPQRDSNSFLGYAIGMQATVRYCKVPKLKGKSRKAARKALSAADCTVGKMKKTKKVRDRKEVVSQSVKPGKAVSDTKPIKLGMSRKQG